MSQEFQHERTKTRRRGKQYPSCLRAFVVSSRRAAVINVFVLVLILAAPLYAQTATTTPAQNKPAPPPPTLYRINFSLDFDARTFNATERVR
ncbi:MAG TPA: hypothetical protein VF634_07280, partial [Pyrinomonadaceae bacterium]